MGWNTRTYKDVKTGRSKLEEVSFGNETTWGAGSGKGILKTKTGGQSPKKQTDGFKTEANYSQKDATSSNSERPI